MKVSIANGKSITKRKRDLLYKIITKKHKDIYEKLKDMDVYTTADKEKVQQSIEECSEKYKECLTSLPNK